MQPAARLLSQAARQTFNTSACSSTCGPGTALCQLPKTFVTAVPAAERLVGACVLERLPVIMPEPATWESEHFAWQAELRNKQSKELPEEFIQEKMVFEQEGGEGGLRRWQPAPRETEADVAMDTQSLRRKLDQRLFLLVKRKGDSSWHFPQTEHSTGETMRQTAERALQETIQEGPQTYFVGNAPMGHIDVDTCKSFYHKVQLIKGQAALKQSANVDEYAWISKQEMPQYIQDEATQALLSQMLGS